MTVFAVFLLFLLQGEGKGLQCGWEISVVRGSLKLTTSFLFSQSSSSHKGYGGGQHLCVHEPLH